MPGQTTINIWNTILTEGHYCLAAVYALGRTINVWNANGELEMPLRTGYEQMPAAPEYNFDILC